MGLNIPVGISDFEKIRSNGYYYVDKSGMLTELLKTKSTEVTLITRPRRFGKTLGMSMLSSFFDIRKDSRALFEGLWQEWLDMKLYLIAKGTPLIEKGYQGVFESLPKEKQSVIIGRKADFAQKAEIRL